MLNILLLLITSCGGSSITSNTKNRVDEVNIDEYAAWVERVKQAMIEERSLKIDISPETFDQYSKWTNAPVSVRSLEAFSDYLFKNELNRARNSLKKTYTFDEWKIEVRKIVDENPILSDKISFTQSEYDNYNRWSGKGEIDLENLWNYALYVENSY